MPSHPMIDGLTPEKLAQATPHLSRNQLEMFNTQIRFPTIKDGY